MAERIPTMYGRYYTINLVWRGREFTLSAFTPKLQKLQRTGAQRIAEKIYPGCRVVSYHESDKTTAPTFLATEGTMKSFREFREDLDLKKMSKELDGASKMHKGQADRIRKHLKKMKSEDNAYAIGMAQAMKSTGDKPPLKKSTIKKAHKIADAVKNEARECPEGTKWCPECQKCQKVTCADAKMKNEDWQKKSGKNPEGGLNEKDASPTSVRIQEAILRDLQRKLGTLVERAFVRE